MVCKQGVSKSFFFFFSGMAYGSYIIVIMSLYCCTYAIQSFFYFLLFME